MALLETLTADMKEAMKARDKARLSTVRLLIAALKNLLIDKREGLTPDDELDFLASQAKRRRESIEAYDKAGRTDLLEQEQAELAVIEGYLPQPLSADEVRAIVAEAVAESGATSKRDMGAVMKLVMPKVKGRFPGKEVRPLVDAALS